MTPAVLIDGAVPPDLSHALAANDRGFHYGDGVFETALLRDGRVRFLDDHLQRLFDGCARLGIRAPERATLLGDIDRVTASLCSGVLKIVISRGTGERGYRPPDEAQATRLVAMYPAPEVLHSFPPPLAGEGEGGGLAARGITLRWCETRLGRNARLAGIKHLNRLEQVLARAEWRNERIDEGLMLDTEGELVCGTASNVFIVREGALVTPDLRFCGVRGVMRGQVLAAAKRLGIAASEEPLWPHDVQGASEVFVTNAVRGIRPVVALDALRWSGAPLAGKLAAALDP